jgi:hypothetical protein
MSKFISIPLRTQTVFGLREQKSLSPGLSIGKGLAIGILKSLKLSSMKGVN